MRLGFVGTGAIAEAMVTGLLAAPSPDLRILLSPRNAEVAARLAARFPDQVGVAGSNQDVLDGCDVAVLAVRPQIVREVAGALRFRADHLVLSLVATLSAAELARLVEPATRIVRAVPLPSVAHGAGPTAIVPPDPVVAGLFDRIGTAIEVDDDEAYAAMAAATGCMATYLTLAGTIASWLAGKGVPAEKAQLYVGRILSGLSGTAARAETLDFGALADEHQTRGGLNEELRRRIGDAGLFREVEHGLEALLKRTRG